MSSHGSCVPELLAHEGEPPLAIVVVAARLTPTRTDWFIRADHTGAQRIIGVCASARRRRDRSSAHGRARALGSAPGHPMTQSRQSSSESDVGAGTLRMNRRTACL
jgi:hypothetical protein